MSARRVLVLALVLVLAPTVAHAQSRVGVIVTGDGTLQAPVSAMITAWLQQHGHQVVPGALPAAATNQLIDCFVLDDTACARRVLARAANGEAVVYARIDAAGADRNVTLSWLDAAREPTSQHAQCAKCTDDALAITIGAMLFALAPAPTTAASAASAPAARVAAAPAAVAEEPAVRATAAPASHAERAGLAAGLELGEPTSATLAWFVGALSFGGAIGTGTLAGPGLSAHADVQLIVAHLSPAVPLRVGLGGRIYHHGYQPMSIDEVPDTHYGVRASAALAYERGPLELYVELAPGVDLYRTPSCTLASGPDSICPHAMAAPWFVQLGVGARWFFSH